MRRSKIVLVSDLLEHTGEFSFIGEFQNLPDIKRSHIGKSKSGYVRIEVTIFFLHREGKKLQTSALRNFWREYLRGQGASVTRFVPIEG